MSARLLRAGVLAFALSAGAFAPALPALAAEHAISVDRLRFGDVPPDIRAGDTIVWKNDDILRHTATARDGSFDIDLPARSEARMVVEAAGNIAFYCRFHPGMNGTLLVGK